MKIIEGLKKIKDLQRKAEDLRTKIGKYCADLDNETPAYETPEKQREQISAWLQAHSDILKEILNLRITIQKTNLETQVTIEIRDEKHVTKSIAEWIHRRKELAGLEAQAWEGLTHKALRPINYRKEGNDTVLVANVRKYFDQQTRDLMVENFTSEPSRIDAALEIINATTNLL